MQQLSTKTVGHGSSPDYAAASSAVTPALSLDSIGLTEVDTLAAKIVTHVHKFMPRDLVNVTILDRRELVVRATIGNRTDRMAGMRFPAQTGLGGLAVMERRVISVGDYARLEWPLPFLDVMVRDEGIRAAVGVPLFVRSEPVGLLFLGRRGGPIPAADIRKLRETSETAGPLLGASMQLARSVEAAHAEERNRLATQLHDEIIPLLFAIGAEARRMRDILPPEAAEALGHTDSIEGMASSANALARGALESLRTFRSDQDLILRIRAASGRFTGLTEQPVSLGIAGHFLTSLTAREHEVLRLVARGMTSREISEELSLSVNTVRSYVQSVLAKLGAHTRIEAISKAREVRLL
jgi:DNA-binding NarL/FixJ family response regulator